MRITKTVVRLTALATLAVGIGVVGAAPSGAAAPVQTCTKVTGSATFTPGLTNTPTNNTVNAKGTQTGCTPTAATRRATSRTAGRVPRNDRAVEARQVHLPVL